MKQLVFIIVTGAIGVFVARMFLVNKDKNSLSDHFKAQDELQRVKETASTAENNASPAFAMIGNLPFVTQILDPIHTNGGSMEPQEIQIPARSNSI